MSSKTEKSEPQINRLVIIGLGLIGSSLAIAAREQGLAKTVIGISRRTSTLELALELGVIDRACDGLEALASELDFGDLVVIGVPTLSVPSVIAVCHEFLSDRVTITDVASVKGSVVKALLDVYGKLPRQFVPGHPIAGSEKSGVEAANSQLFKDHRVILTPHNTVDCEHLSLVSALWSDVGAVVSTMNVEEHDAILAATSHLPHFLAYSLVDTLASVGDNREIFRYAAGGFRDFTRIAASDPVMWRDIALANRESILSILDQVMNNFQALRGAIDKGDQDYLMDVFTRARDARNHFGKLLENKALQGPMTEKTINYRISPGGNARGDVRVPGDKSMSHRSIMLGSLAQGMTEVTGFLEAADTFATQPAYRYM